MSHVVRKPAFAYIYIYAKPKAQLLLLDQLPRNPAADQRLCFYIIDSTMLLHVLPKSEISSLWSSPSPVRLGPGKNPEAIGFLAICCSYVIICKFIKRNSTINFVPYLVITINNKWFEWWHEKTCLWGFRADPIKTGLKSLEDAWNFRFRK